MLTLLSDLFDLSDKIISTLKKTIMKKAFIAIMICAALVSCNNKSDKAADSEKENIEAVETEDDEDAAETLAAGEGVIEASDDADITPGMSVERPLLLDFNATWCGPCQQFKPVFHGVAAKYSNVADFVSVDSDQCPNITAAFGVESLPTLIVLLPDGTSKQFVGLNEFMQTEEAFAAYVEGLL